MAVLTNADVMELWLLLYRKGEGKEEFGKNGNVLPTVAQRAAIFQAIEDRMIAAVGQVDGDIDAILGRNVPIAAVRKAVCVWLRWRDQKGL